MADRPIIFSAPMVRALIREAEAPGTGKTQTRRVIKPGRVPSLFDDTWSDSYVLDPGNASWRERDVRYAAGDRLWVREAWRTFASMEGTPPRDLYRPGARGAGVLFEADNGGLAITKAGDATLGSRDDRAAFGKLRTPLFLPRWASRLTLIVTDVRVQRLHDISEADAVAEGVEHWPAGSPVTGSRYGIELHPRIGRCVGDTARDAFRSLWQTLHGPDAWDANPWVAALTFDVVQANIDRVDAEPRSDLTLAPSGSGDVREGR